MWWRQAVCLLLAQVWTGEWRVEVRQGATDGEGWQYRGALAQEGEHAALDRPRWAPPSLAALPDLAGLRCALCAMCRVL
jgi:hypothetical protein